MNTFYLTCFTLGFVLSILAAFGGLGRLHFGHPETKTGPFFGRAENALQPIAEYDKDVFQCWTTLLSSSD